MNIESYKNRTLDQTKPVRVYRNAYTLNYSIKQKVGGSWKTIGHTKEISLFNVRFIPKHKGRPFFIVKHKNYSKPFIEGFLTPKKTMCNRFRQVYYDSMRNFFYIKNPSKERIHEAKSVLITGDSILSFSHEYKD